MTAAVILALLPLFLSQRQAVNTHMAAQSGLKRPIRTNDFDYCEKGCGSKQYTGTYMTKSNCAVCNPELSKYKHTGGTWTDSVTRIRRSALHAVRCFLMRRSRAAQTAAPIIEDITSTNPSISQADTTINICTATIAGKTSTIA